MRGQMRGVYIHLPEMYRKEADTAPLISQKSKIFASSPQGKPWALPRQSIVCVITGRNKE